MLFSSSAKEAHTHPVTASLHTNAQLLDGPLRTEREELLNEELSDALILELDDNDDGEVDRVEWLKGMLVALDEVDAELIDIILAQYDKLDKDGNGTLNMDDVRAAVEERARSHEPGSLTGTLTPGRHRREVHAYPGYHEHTQRLNVGVFHF